MKHLKLLIIYLLLFILQTGLAQDSLSSYKKEIFVSKLDSMPYRILFPPHFSAEKSYPLVVFLHGAGERGNDNEKQLIHGSSLFTSPEALANYPSIVLFPQCPSDDYWAKVKIDRNDAKKTFDFLYTKPPTRSMNNLIQLIDKLLDGNYINKDQVYVMGLSMGAMGVYEILYRKPNTFAAGIAICGGGNTHFAKNFAKQTPLWIFHGSRDDVVDPKYSVRMVEAILEAGAYPKFTLFEDANHNSWDPAFAQKEILPWLFSKTRKP
ncbi:MAG TPA: phospholipase [Bacteroidales bacterium]|nr:phospholipase [Bacteroidales bacterium]